MSSPFDDHPTEAPSPPPPKRKRRPWWRWNLTTLMVALFLLVWVRELGRLGYGMTWFMAFCLLSAWFCGPVLVQGVIEPPPASPPPRPKGPPTMPPAAAPAAKTQGRLGKLRFLRGAASVGIGLALVRLVISFFTTVWAAVQATVSFDAGFSSIFAVVAHSLLSPIGDLLLALILYVLTIIAEQLVLQTSANEDGQSPATHSQVSPSTSSPTSPR